jgi:exosortase
MTRPWTARVRSLPWGRFAAAAGLVGALSWAYWPVLAEIVRKWQADPQYSHGYLVPAFSLYLLWWRRGHLAGARSGPDWWGAGLLAVGLALRLAGAYCYFAWFEAASLLPLLAGAALLLGGWPALRWAWPAVGFLVFMVPLPYRVETGLAAPLQRVATVAAAYTLQTLGLPALAEGNTIRVNEARIGVVGACSGLGMLLLFFALATGLAVRVRRPWPDRLVVVASAVPVAVAANVVRITATAFLHVTAGGRVAAVVYHDLAGWLMMPLALGMLWLELKALSRLLPERRPAAAGPGRLALALAPLPRPRPRRARQVARR